MVGFFHNILYLADLLSMCFTKRSTEDSEILTEDKDLSTINQTMSSDNTITIVLFFFHTEFIATMSLQHIILTERSIINWKENTLSSSQLTTLGSKINSC